MNYWLSRRIESHVKICAGPYDRAHYRAVVRQALVRDPPALDMLQVKK